MVDALGQLRVGDYVVEHGGPNAACIRVRDKDRIGVYPEYRTATIPAEDFEVILARIVEELG